MPEQYIRKFALAITNLDAKTFLATFLENCCSFNHYYVIHLNLTKIKKPLPARLTYTFGLLGEEDLEQVRKQIHQLDPGSRRHLVSRLHCYDQGLRNCYGLQTSTNEIACMQWIIYPEENRLLSEYFPRRYLPLKDGQVMLENVFVFPKYRGLGLVQPISHELLQIAKAHGFRTAIGYIRKDSLLSLNEFMRMGFTIKRLVPEYKFFGYTKRLL